MKLLIELPSWLGDTVMTTPAIENIIHHYPTAEISLIGSFNSIQVLKYHPKINKTYVIEKNIVSIFHARKFFEEFDLFFSFRGSLRAQFTRLLVPAKRKFQFNYKKYINRHQVEKYNSFINDSLDIKTIPNKLIIHKIGKNSRNQKSSKNRKNKLLGINPGASYGSAKRWYPKKFSDVAVELADKYDILIFGASDEKNFAKDIAKYLDKKAITNYQNLAGKTSLNELISIISELDLFLTGDSGPMHIAAAFDIPTLSIFGPTNYKETSQWMNNRSAIIKKNIDCQPCLKRKCPLNHHKCMKLINSSDVLAELKKLD